MRLIINGEPLEVTSRTLGDLLGELDYEGEWLATALNGELVRAAARSTFTLNEGDKVEILTPRQGG
ncbi:sulfur carrier protein ThiS [Phyllobacterium sp. TAF24]|uniref:sulfur carrier protein ThiS n=1 Tax=Phyllobacterium sp. TAF24 TaxID=3233068 RepID=UPI003F960924